jgi:hypothetical protein
MIDLHSISQQTFDDGIDYEVSGRAVYEQRYRRLTWPKERSGPTGAIGYDLARRPRRS